ncbi:MASE1 domain-containing protein [Ramlibacter sp. PS3R-8]|uniref:MASE1 domain-containing protein n=1 Tax=Ramlibacter sp. PS3R-8 TaxID=3133437 RepID=UPI0030AE11CA
MGRNTISHWDGKPEVRAGAWPGGQAALSLRWAFWLLATGACYYLATRIAWTLTFPGSKVSLLFPPHAVLVSILLLVPTRQWWAYALAAAGSHFFATQQEQWPLLYALQSEAFDVAKGVLTAAGIRLSIQSPFDRINLREAIAFFLVAVVVVPAGTAFWGAAITVSNHSGTEYWTEWRNLCISNGVTAMVLVPAILIGARRIVTGRFKVTPSRILEAGVLAVAVAAVGWLSFDRLPAGPDTSPALLYAPVPLLIWAALRFGLGGISASVLVIAAQAIWGTMQGRGPFLTQTPVENAVALQLFLLMVATPLMLLAVAIEEERGSKEALRVSQERMSLAVDSAQLALWDWDVVNDRVWMTDEGRKFFCFAPGEPLHYASLAGRVHPDDAAVRATAIQRALEMGGSYEAEYRVILPDGSVRWIAARGRRSPVVDGAPARILGVSMDVTVQKQARAEAQRQREELAHLSRVGTLSALSGSLAHELTQPLASILWNAQAGQRFTSQDAPDIGELRAIFADIDSGASRAGEIIGRLRTMLRRGEVKLQPVSVKESLQELLDLTRGVLVARGVSVSNLATGELPPALTDRVQLQQVLLNLILNACDAMEANPPGDRNLTLTTATAQNEVRIGVLDCGIGLPDDIESMFQPFHTTKADGLGMGLSICRTLVTSHGGRVWAERGAERGAAFYVALPLAQQDAQG